MPHLRLNAGYSLLFWTGIPRLNDRVDPSINHNQSLQALRADPTVRSHSREVSIVGRTVSVSVQHSNSEASDPFAVPLMSISASMASD